MSIRDLLFATVAAASISAPALAQTTFPAGPAEFEGLVTGLDQSTITIFNSNATLTSTTVYATPTRDGMSIADVMTCNSARMPGLTRTGWACLRG